jgi:hypothetical protein
VPSEDSNALAAVGLDDLRHFLAAAKTNTDNVHVIIYFSRDEIIKGLAPAEFEKVTALCQELGIPTHSTREWFPIERTEELFRDNIHPNSAGQQQLAAAILESVPFEGMTREDSPQDAE